MSTREDILEQIVEEYLIHKGYFVQHNVRYRPSSHHPYYNSKKDCTHSDIDVLGINPTLRGRKRVIVVNCKSWQEGFDIRGYPDDFEIERKYLKSVNWEKEATGYGQWRFWKQYRELCNKKWADALVNTIEDLTGTSCFTHVTAYSWLKNGKGLWETDPRMRKILHGNFCEVWTFEQMASEIMRDLNQTLAPSEVGRLLQMFKAARIPEFEAWVKRLQKEHA